MIGKILALIGSGLVSYAVFYIAGSITASLQIAIFITGICAFSLGMAAARDGFWRD